MFEKQGRRTDVRRTEDDGKYRTLKDSTKIIVKLTQSNLKFKISRTKEVHCPLEWKELQYTFCHFFSQIYYTYITSIYQRQMEKKNNMCKKMLHVHQKKSILQIYCPLRNDFCCIDLKCSSLNLYRIEQLLRYALRLLVNCALLHFYKD